MRYCGIHNVDYHSDCWRCSEATLEQCIDNCHFSDQATIVKTETRTSGNLAPGGRVPAEEGKVLRFSLPSFPPSVNSMYLVNHNQRRVSLSDEALLWRTRVFPSILPCRLDFPTYKLTLTYQSPRWLIKNGDLRRADVSNMDKLTIDTLCSKWGFDDSRLTEVVRRKEWYEWDRILVLLEQGHELRATHE